MNRRAATAVLLPVLGLALSGCASGRHNAQYLEKSAINGSNASLGGLGIRNAYFTTPAATGGKATLVFSIYADDPDAATTLESVTSEPLDGSTPALLASVNSSGGIKPASALPIKWQTGPGANVFAAQFQHILTDAKPAAYYPVVFTFANGVAQTVQVAVAQNGDVNPAATAIPTAFPEEPFPLVTALPGQGGTS